MGASNNSFTSFSAASAAALAAVGLILITAAQIPLADARKFPGVNPFCRTADYRNLCTEMVKGATNWHDASVNAMESAMDLAKKLQAMAPEEEKLPPGTPPKDPRAQKNQVIQICKENLDGVVDDLRESVEALGEKDIGTVRSHLSGALRTDCKEAMDESNVDFPFSKYLGLMKRNIDNCLAVVLQN